MDVLVGLTGRAEAALRTAIELIGTNVGSLTLANVVIFAESSPQARRDKERAAELLETAANSIQTLIPGRVLLTGQPADALMNHAAEQDYDLLTGGRRGRGASKALLGRTAARSANGTIPVLIV